MASSLFGTPSTPPLAQAPQQTQLTLEEVKKLGQMFKAASNPQAFVQNLMVNSPNTAAQVLGLVQKHNGNYQAAFLELAKMKGIDPEAFMQALQ